MDRIVVALLFHQPHHDLHLIAEFDFLGWSQQRFPTDRGQVPGHRVGTSSAKAVIAGDGGDAHGVRESGLTISLSQSYQALFKHAFRFGSRFNTWR